MNSFNMQPRIRASKFSAAAAAAQSMLLIPKMQFIVRNTATNLKQNSTELGEAVMWSTRELGYSPAVDKPESTRRDETRRAANRLIYCRRLTDINILYLYIRMIARKMDFESLSQNIYDIFNNYSRR